MATVATNDWPGVFKSLLHECDVRGAVWLTAEVMPIIWPRGVNPATEDPPVMPDVESMSSIHVLIKTPPILPLTDERTYMCDKLGDDTCIPIQRRGKKRRLNNKMHPAYLRAPQYVVRCMNRDDNTGLDLWVCKECKAVTFRASALWNAWGARCRECQDKYDELTGPGANCNHDWLGAYVCDCGFCELPLFESDTAENNCRPQLPVVPDDGDDGDLLWCQDCSMTHGSNYTGG